MLEKKLELPFQHLTEIVFWKCFSHHCISPFAPNCQESLDFFCKENIHGGLC